MSESWDFPEYDEWGDEDEPDWEEEKPSKMRESYPVDDLNGQAGLNDPPECQECEPSTKRAPTSSKRAKYRRESLSEPYVMRGPTIMSEPRQRRASNS